MIEIVKIVSFFWKASFRSSVLFPLLLDLGLMQKLISLFFNVHIDTVFKWKIFGCQSSGDVIYFGFKGGHFKIFVMNFVVGLLELLPLLHHPLNLLLVHGILVDVSFALLRI